MKKVPILTSNHQHLQLLFHQIPPEFLRTQLEQGQSLSGSPCLSVGYCSPQVYHRFAMDREPCFSDTEVRNMGVDLLQKIQNIQGHTIFHFLLSQSQEMLTLEENYPLCSFDSILSWRELSKNLGQDLFTTSFLASLDLTHGIQRTDFCWKPVLSTDHKALQQLLARGISDHHFHLNGSVPIHTLSWTYLMNHPRKINGLFGNPTVRGAFSEDLLGKSQEDGTQWREGMKAQVWQAVALRGKLFQNIHSPVDLSTALDPITAMGQQKVISHIEMLRYLEGYPFLQVHGKKSILDYCFHGGLGAFHQHQNRIFAGERQLQYLYFQKIFKGESSPLEANLFYYYLLLQNAFYSQMVQVNQRLGFENFTKYQNRKDMFFSQDPPYEREAKRVGIYGAFQDQKLLSLEARITFKNTAQGQHQAIKGIDRVYDFAQSQRKEESPFPSLTSPWKEKVPEYPYYYVLHFIKKADPPHLWKENTWQEAKPRNDQTRREIYQQARALQQLMVKYPRVRGRIRGIDACSGEIGCRPETFATEFRYLRGNSQFAFPTAPWIPQAVKGIQLTFHAGEDFLDLLDGLRAIDETVRFLEYTRGDRLGHALALGVLPEDYYEMKQYRVILPKQDLLDNLLWFYYRSQEYQLTLPQSLCQVLEMEGRKLLYELYQGKEGSTSDMEQYYHSMQLRGDHPDLCREEKESPCFSHVSSYDRWKPQKDSALVPFRTFPRVVEFLRRYHFDPKTRNLGNTLTTWEVPLDWIPCIRLLQEKIQWDLTEREIAVECNPSSNVLIGTARDYQKHPVFRFYNQGLEGLYPQYPKGSMDVSLNTDDLGVFATSLENEYGMLACTLQKAERSGERLSPHEIFSYLEQLRIMGNRQSFQNPS